VSDPIRVVIADDHPIVREGLRTYLGTRDGIEVVGEAADGEQAAARVARLHPDVVLLDLVMPVLDGVAALERILARDPDARVIVLTSFAAEDQMLPALRAGAAGYLLKDTDPAELERAVRAAAAGESLLSPVVAERLLREVRRSPSGDPLAALTPREREVLGLLARGLSNRQIAAELVVAEKTVKTHVSNVLAKLSVADRTQAALLAVRAGLGPPAG